MSHVPFGPAGEPSGLPACPVVPLRPQEERRTKERGIQLAAACSAGPGARLWAPCCRRLIRWSFEAGRNPMGAWCRLADQGTGVLRRGERLASEGRGPVKRVMTGPATASRRT